jgi:hypothetical protein
MSTEMKILRGCWTVTGSSESRATIESRANIQPAFYFASWKMMPSDIRDPSVTVLTPWRMETR